MTEVRRVANEEQAEQLAAHLNGTERARPTVVVTTPAQSPEPYIDAERIADELGDLAEVYVIETGPHTWAFSRRMADQTQVYGGAGRAYPPGHDWVTDRRRSPLRFAFDQAEGDRATTLLIEDGLDMAALAGLIGADTATHRRRAEGEVVRVISERAFVKVDAGMPLVVPPQLAAPDVPLDRVLTKGMRVHGWYDEQSRWFDVRESRLDPVEAVAAAYRPGDTVLALVSDIEADVVRVQLHPEVIVDLPRRSVTSDAAADLRELFSRDEVVRLQLLETSPTWTARLADPGGDVVPAVALYPGGPPWLIEPEEPEVAYEAEQPAPITPTVASVPLEAVTPEPSPLDESADAQEDDDVAATRGPTPLAMPRRRGETVRPAVAAEPAPELPARPSGAAITSLSLKVTELQARVADLEARLTATEHERQQLVVLRQEDQATIHRQEIQLRKLRKKVRTAGTTSADPAPVAFADREKGFRYLVLTAWARRTPVAEQPERPLPDFMIGPDFLESLDQVEGISESKVADVVFEIATGLAEQMPGRDVHPLRTGPGGSDPVCVRDDGARCWRAALQQNTPSARRIHYWRLPGGGLELSRVVLHDDMTP